jgi:hypothetical protein
MGNCCSTADEPNREPLVGAVGYGAVSTTEPVSLAGNEYTAPGAYSLNSPNAATGISCHRFVIVIRVQRLRNDPRRSNHQCRYLAVLSSNFQLSSDFEFILLCMLCFELLINMFNPGTSHVWGHITHRIIRAPRLRRGVCRRDPTQNDSNRFVAIGIFFCYSMMGSGFERNRRVSYRFLLI